MAENEKTSLVRSIVEKISAIQIAVAVVSTAAIAAITWFMINGENTLKNDKDFLFGILIFSAVIVGLTVLLIAIFYLVFGSSSEGTSLFEQMTNVFVRMPPMQVVATVIGFVTVGLIAWFIIAGGDVFTTPDKARGLITFSVAIVTVAIALIMVLYVIFGVATETEFSSRFTFGKDVLMVFVGILGTIMGFYYGTDKVSTKDIPVIQGSADTGATATKVLETKAFDLLINKSFEDAEKAFDLVAKATPPSANVANVIAIEKFLTDKQADYNAANDQGKRDIWKDLYCKISKGHMAEGMSKETIDKFDSGCAQLSATPTPTPSPK